MGEERSIGEGGSIGGDVFDIFWEGEESGMACEEGMGSVCGEVMGLSERLG